MKRSYDYEDLIEEIKGDLLEGSIKSIYITT